MHGPARGVLLEAVDDAPAGPPPVGGGGATAVAAAPAPARGVLRVRDLDRRELAVVAPLIALIIGLGVYPQPLLNLIEPAVAATLSDVGTDDGGTDR